MEKFIKIDSTEFYNEVIKCKEIVSYTPRMAYLIMELTKKVFFSYVKKNTMSKDDYDDIIGTGYLRGLEDLMKFDQTKSQNAVAFVWRAIYWGLSEGWNILYKKSKDYEFIRMNEEYMF